MSQVPFIGFGSFSRPEIGLISDGSQNLSEIFESDKRDALRNILLSPEVLDSIYGVSKVVNREDFRSVSGLSKLLLPSLNVQTDILTEVIPRKLYEDKQYYTPQFPLGGNSSGGIKSPEVIIFNGLIKCEGAEYRANIIGDRLFSNPVRQKVSISTSRASLFSTESEEGQILSAKYPGVIRVRRRSHVNRVFVPKSLFITKPPVSENPSHRIRVNVDNGDTGTTIPVDLLATKNSPLKIYCRIGVGSVKFTFTDDEAPYFYGYQVQPIQQRPNTPFVEFLQLPASPQTSGSTTFTVNIDIRATGYQDLYDLYLYLYVNPEKVKGIEFSGINLRETPDRKDIGLIGFDNLESLVISGGTLTILPLWLKTLKNKLVNLDLSLSGNTWRGGPMEWFDIRDPSAVPSSSFPQATVISYLTIPKAGSIVNNEGDDWSDELFEKYVKNSPRVANTDYRQFTSLTSLRIGNRFNGRSPRFDDVAPNLSTLNWSGISSSRYLFGDLPKLANNGQLINYNISGSRAIGNIEQIGTSTDSEDTGHISKYKFVTFSSSDTDLTGYIGDPSQDWSNWRSSAVSINLSRAGSNIKINLQSDVWQSLISIGADRCGGVTFSSPSTPLKTPKLSSLNIDYSGSTGQLPSLGTSDIENTGELTSFRAFGCNSLDAVVFNGVNYWLPINFAPFRPSESAHKLNSLSIGENTLEYRFRKNDLINLYQLTRFELFRTPTTGKLPEIPLTEFPDLSSKQFQLFLRECNIYDIRNLSIRSSNSLLAQNLDRVEAASLNVSNGGALIPSFEGTSDSIIKYVNISGSLVSTYRNDWFDSTKRGSIILNSDPPSEVTDLSISRIIQSTSGLPWSEEDNIYKLTSSTGGLRQKVLVNDSVKLSPSGQEVARVLSVSDLEIIIDRDIPGTIPSSLFFSRNTVSINNWFSSGFTELTQFAASNCRLSGSLNIRSGFSRIFNLSIIGLDLSNNGINGYVKDSLSPVFSGNPRRITVDISRNNLSISDLQSIIDDVYTLDLNRRFTDCIVRIGFNKISSDGRYSNYTQSELFPTTIRQTADVITRLTRNEQFYTFTNVTTTDEFGNTLTERVITGTRTISIPGQFVMGSYYLIKRDKTRQVIENSIGIKLRNLRGILVDLGFNYIRPNTSILSYETLYEDQTTRYGSIIAAGYDPADLVNP